MGSGILLNPHTKAYRALILFSPWRFSKNLYTWHRLTRVLAYPKASDTGFGQAKYSTGILTCFPFVNVELQVHLGSTNSRLTNIAGKTLLLRRSGFSPDFMLLPIRFSFMAGPQEFTPPLLPYHNAFLLNYLIRYSKVSVSCFSPVHLRRYKPR